MSFKKMREGKKWNLTPLQEAMLWKKAGVWKAHLEKRTNLPNSDSLDTFESSAKL